MRRNVEKDMNIRTRTTHVLTSPESCRFRRNLRLISLTLVPLVRRAPPSSRTTDSGPDEAPRAKAASENILVFAERWKMQARALTRALQNVPFPTMTAMKVSPTSGEALQLRSSPFPQLCHVTLHHGEVRIPRKRYMGTLWGSSAVRGASRRLRTFPPSPDRNAVSPTPTHRYSGN